MRTQTFEVKVQRRDLAGKMQWRIVSRLSHRLVNASWRKWLGHVSRVREEWSTAARQALGALKRFADNTRHARLILMRFVPRGIVVRIFEAWAVRCAVAAVVAPPRTTP